MGINTSEEIKEFLEKVKGKEVGEFKPTAEGDLKYSFHAELYFDEVPEAAPKIDFCACVLKTECGLYRSSSFAFDSKNESLQDLRELIEEYRKLLLSSIRKYKAKSDAANEFRSQNIV